MKTVKTSRRNRRDRGFTLIELLVAAAVTVLVCGAALALSAKHAPLFNQQQNYAALNIQIRNAVSQLQLDTINAGSGFYQGTNIANAPIGVTIQNNTTTPCNTATTFTYGPNCFDQINIINVDPATPASHPSNGAGASINTDTASTIYATPVSPTTAAQLAADFNSGDQLLLVSSNGSKMTAVELTAAGVVSGSLVKLTIGTTTAGGKNTSDPAYIAVNATSYLTSTFGTADWILKIIPITYKVDTSTASDPKLIREQPSGVTANDVVVAEQVVGFKVGAITWNSCIGGCTSDDGSTYNYDSSSYSNSSGAQAYDFPLIRSIQMALIGRTNPNPDPTYRYTNGFDQGPYQIESVSVVVDPRNLTMGNN